MNWGFLLLAIKEIMAYIIINFIWTIKKVSIKVDSNVTGGGGIEEIQK